MSEKLSKRERVESALAGEAVDRVPVSAWGHLIPAEKAAESFVEASLAFFRRYDWDWLKVNPRATYFAEAWGSVYDFEDYSGVFPRFVRDAAGALDFGELKPVGPSAKPWAEQLEALRGIKRGMGGAPLVQTIFSPASVLAFLAGRTADRDQAAISRDQEASLARLVRGSPDKAHHALSVIAESLAGLAAASLEAGADGIYFAITRLARKGVLSPEEYGIFGKPYDLKVLEAARGATFNILHSCGPEIHWGLIQDYPVRALSWAAAGRGNPGLGEARESSSFAFIGGLDEEGALRHGGPPQVREAARAALRLGGTGKFLLAPGCSVDPSVSEANLRALREAVEGD